MIIHRIRLNREQRDFVGLSFDTISSVGENGAIIHYKPVRETCKTLDVSQIYLCDSGYIHMSESFVAQPIIIIH